MLTQVECELRMYHGGIKRAEAMMQKAEDKGRAVTNPYAKEILDEFVLPLSSAIRAELDSKRAGARKAHATLLKGLDPDAVALLAVRTTLNSVLSQGSGQHRNIGHDIGRTVYNELILVQIEESHPELYHTLARDFARRLSKDERHRMTVYKLQAKKAGIDLIEWPIGARDQVGLYLLGLLEVAGMIEIEEQQVQGKYKLPRVVRLSFDLMQRIDSVKAYVAITMPVYGPVRRAA